MALFSAVQVETAQPLGPPDGRYLIRPAVGADPSHVLVFAGTLATIVAVDTPLGDEAQAAAWFKQAGERELERGLAVLEAALHAFRLIVADAHVIGPGRRQLVVGRVGYGSGPELAEGRFTQDREIPAPRGPRFQRRAKVLEPQARLAAALSGREPPLVCGELALRASYDLEHGRPREAALQLMVALNAAITELSVDDHAAELAERTRELRELLDGVTTAAQTALSGPLSAADCDAVSHALGRLEAALRARAVLNA